jgi:hypothetical protein
MVEQGLVMLIQQGIASLTPSVPGGYGVQLPKDLISDTVPMAWSYRAIVAEPSYVLEGQDAFTGLELQIDCHGFWLDPQGRPTMANAINLARAIEGVLRGGWAGTLPDPDATVVQGIFRQSHYVDGFSHVNRSYVRSLEYLVNYDQI